MLTPVVYIEVADRWGFRSCSAFSVKRDVDSVAATGTVELSLSAALRNKQRKLLQVKEIIKDGDPIRLSAGYAETGVKVLFNGYVRNRTIGERMRLTLEDEFYIFRKTPLVHSAKDVPLTDLLTVLLADTGVGLHPKCAKLKIDEFTYSGNVAGALLKIKETLKLTAYMTSEGLYVGGEMLENEDACTVAYGRNMVSNNTTYKTKEANPLLVRVVGKKRDGTEVSVVVGVDGGDKHTLHRYNVTDESTLKAIGEEYVLKRCYDGFDGSIKLWGIPLAAMGGTLKYSNECYEDAEGRYFIKGVEHTFSTAEGLRQVVRLGQRLG